MFEYDPDKSAANLAKHGIDFEQAQALWQDNRKIMADTYPGNGGEIRNLVIGEMDGKLWAAVITMREDIIRIMSVRRARSEERNAYDSQED